MTNPLLAAALGYAAAGWPVFPCVPLGKVPIGTPGFAPNGFKNATTDPVQVREWWQRQPNANPAVATGDPGPDVLDIDCKDGRDGLDLFHKVREAGLCRGAAATIRTPSGGWHVWFIGTTQGGGAVGKGRALELKARGGYVLVPPAYVVSSKYGYSGRYTLVEEASHSGDVIDFTAVRRLLNPPPKASRRELRGEDNLHQLLDFAASLPDGNRNNGFYWACRRAVEKGASESFLDQMVDAVSRTGLPRSSAEATMRSAARHRSAA